MSENLSKKPSKSILKSSNSVDRTDYHGPSTSRISKEQRFDEVNIMATLHPADKDYGHMKIDEPKTPYEEHSDTNLNPSDQLDAKLLSAKLAASMNKPLRNYDQSDSDPELPETSEGKARRKEFEKKRKMHYNEFQAIQTARQLLAEEEDEEEDCYVGCDEGCDEDCDDECKRKCRNIKNIEHKKPTTVEQNKATSPKRPFKSKTKP